MADALSRALSAGVSLAEIKKMQADGLPLEEIANAAEQVQSRGEEEIAEDVRPGDFSDVGNMDKFLELNEGRLLFTDSRGWLYWNGVCWVADDHRATKNAAKMSDKMLQEAQVAYKKALHAQADAKAEEDKEAMEKTAAAVRLEKAYLDHAMRTRSDRRIKAILELAKHFLAIDPARLDANPEELNTPKGIINLKTGEMRPCDKSALCTKVTACAPGSAGAKMWISFLESVTGGDSSFITYLQMVAGMALFGRVYEEGIVLAYGPGRNGKSTLFNALAAVLGDYAGTLDIAVLTTDRQNRGAALATLRGKRLVIAGELEEGKRLSVSTLKQISSTDPITVEEKYRSPETIIPTHTLILYSNHEPWVGSTDDGTWRRIRVAPFKTRISRGIPNYGEKLVNEAGPAILAWAIQGAMMFAENGYRLPSPEVVEEATEEYRQRENWLENFLEECCIMEPDARAPAGELYQTYREWAQRSGDYVRRDVEFSDAMAGKGFVKKVRDGRRFWLGIKKISAIEYRQIV
ncbi:phage/plasmid primase, P4 family [uncultured Oscillibacter sp.]|uniref:DNA primase family protein n=1 Tax=uncultured Oscillibacter sp. TaxID=876091 RepID=UPI002805245A|nr:phage/plasmid primase, P4 family [uncultured Oscillibacter sp.]